MRDIDTSMDCTDYTSPGAQFQFLQCECCFSPRLVDSEIDRYNSLQDPMELTLSHRQRVHYGLSGNPRM